eukprot:9029523-Lingulodinium_polyedra.AAC.1
MRTAVNTHAIPLDDSFNGVAHVHRVALGHECVRTFAWVMQVVAITELVERVGQSGVETSHPPRFLNARA